MKLGELLDAAILKDTFRRMEQRKAKRKAHADESRRRHMGLMIRYKNNGQNN